MIENIYDKICWQYWLCAIISLNIQQLNVTLSLVQCAYKVNVKQSFSLLLLNVSHFDIHSNQIFCSTIWLPICLWIVWREDTIYDDVVYDMSFWAKIISNGHPNWANINFYKNWPITLTTLVWYNLDYSHLVE